MFFVEKIIEAYAYWHMSDINVWNFNETLTNNVVISFEQLGPVLLLILPMLELTRLSITTTSYPASTSSTRVWDPTYPAPPVTSILPDILKDKSVVSDKT